jgi:aerobic-type carbon monoxide dehydrogenase small subunit (CoxS/CutS family)
MYQGVFFRVRPFKQRRMKVIRILIYIALSIVCTALSAQQKEYENPTDEEILHYLNGNLCRCSGYVSQLRAIKNFMEAEKK